ncbi:hypothetical protein [Paracoccus jeotgali]|uniref:Uncharacterized protein n=2 Tax=Paracoccus jeotgali TaxID=2065379 RepID=A0A2K9MJJ8_9RHOB|nr:hypothetical protein [Paracoccus jeotgali]AUM75784.1 hypothetical protein CYR75_15255 [Paracoccus jeotgali]
MTTLTRLAAVLAATLWLAPVQAQTTDHLGLPGPITLAGDSFALAWSSRTADNYIKQEYLPAGETPDNYSRMVSVETVTGGVGVMDAVRAQTETLTRRKATDPLVNMEVIQNEATGEALLDFIVSSRNEAGEYVVEWNVYRYAPLAVGERGAGVMLFGISHRASGNDAAKTFLQELPVLRPTRIKALAAAPLPELGG